MGGGTKRQNGAGKKSRKVWKLDMHGVKLMGAEKHTRENEKRGMSGEGKSYHKNEEEVP